ncbi:MAG TPA: NADH-quinone oxidoreductase subunit NuoG [Verrucomicrobiae bacterium]|nr:NADH-quinone oxidoreductase subunit NuoG [Verrucomicrobiae bacterium]
MSDKKKSRIIVDGKSLQVEAGSNLLQAALGQGLDVPYFCWHPALGSVGACRQCAVIQYKDEADTTGRVVMSCMTPCTEGARFSVEHPEARDMRASVVELLMTNHPHDCPVCEEGGHCHLQDMTVMTGHNYRRYRHTKRTHRNQDLGPFISHEMNRCIACYRCVRYYKDYAGGHDLDVFGSGAEVYFGRAESGTLESPFSGNLVEVCPTGVFTDKPYGESYTRKWDLQSSPSICAGCSIGCNISPGERYGKLKRIENRYHGEINGYFICDRGRFGYGHVNRDDRPKLDAGGGEAAIAQVAQLLAAGKVVAIGSPRAPLETNHALRALVGDKNFSSGQSAADAELTQLALKVMQGPAKVASIRDAEQADAVLVLGEDVLATGARLALALRQATRQASFAMGKAAHVPTWQDASIRTLAQDVKSPLFNVTPFGSALDEVAAVSLRAAPVDIARLGMAVAHALEGTAPIVTALDASMLATAANIAKALLGAERPLIVSGTNQGSVAVLQAVSNIVAALARVGRAPSVSLVFAESNSVGVGLMGGATVDEILSRVESGSVQTLIVAENDLFRRASPAKVEAALSKLKNLVVLDSISTPTTARATVFLPAGSFAESDGTLVNNEGRAQRFFQTFVAAAGEIRESWRWLQQVSAFGGVSLGDNLDALTAACAAATPALAGIVEAAPSAKFRIAGAKVPRQPHRYSGRTAMHAQRDVHEPRPAQDADSPLAFSMEGATGLGPEPAPLIPMFWYPSWNSPQAVNKFQDEIGGHLKGGDPGVHLLQHDAEARPAWFNPPAATNGLRAVPRHDLFGSEELSAQAPVMASRIGEPRALVNPDSKLADGSSVTLAVDGAPLTLVVHVDSSVPKGCIGIPAGRAGLPYVAPGAAVTIGGKA